MFGSPSTGLLRIAKVGTLSTIDPISVNIVRTIYNLVESEAPIYTHIHAILNIKYNKLRN